MFEKNWILYQTLKKMSHEFMWHFAKSMWHFAKNIWHFAKSVWHFVRHFVTCVWHFVTCVVDFVWHFVWQFWQNVRQYLTKCKLSSDILSHNIWQNVIQHLTECQRTYITNYHRRYKQKENCQIIRKRNRESIQNLKTYPIDKWNIQKIHQIYLISKVFRYCPPFPIDK